MQHDHVPMDALHWGESKATPTKDLESLDAEVATMLEAAEQEDAEQEAQRHLYTV